jgi:predicted nucleic acid-binding protein
LDSAVFIYQIEGNPAYVELTHQIFSWLKTAGVKGITSTITMLEVLVHPYRQSDLERVDLYYGLLSTYPRLEWVAASLEIADTAAHLRAGLNLRTPDAVQASTAIHSAATGFISNDPVFRKIQALDVLILDDLIDI